VLSEIAFSFFRIPCDLHRFMIMHISYVYVKI
jgi:hypothetical protein